MWSPTLPVFVRLERLAEVQRNLMAEEIEIHPGVRAAAFLATEGAAVETARAVEVGYVVGEGETANAWGIS